MTTFPLNANVLIELMARQHVRLGSSVDRTVRSLQLARERSAYEF